MVQSANKVSGFRFFRKRLLWNYSLAIITLSMLSTCSLTLGWIVSHSLIQKSRRLIRLAMRCWSSDSSGSTSGFHREFHFSVQYAGVFSFSFSIALKRARSCDTSAYAFSIVKACSGSSRRIMTVFLSISSTRGESTISRIDSMCFLILELTLPGVRVPQSQPALRVLLHGYPGLMNPPLFLHGFPI